MKTTTQSNKISAQLGALGFSMTSLLPKPHVTKEWKAVAFPVTLYYRNAPVISIEFKMGTGHFDPSGELTLMECAELAMNEGITPELSDVLQSLMLDGEAFFTSSTFSQWCDDTGYSDDSIKAKETFDECYATGKALSESVPGNVLNAVRAILQDF